MTVNELADLIADALEGCLKDGMHDKAVQIIEEEINVRKAIGDCP